MTTVFTNATVFTGDENSALHEAVAIRCGRVLAVGDAETVSQVAGKGAETIDMNGTLVAPGFVEAHTHMTMLGQAVDKVQLRDCANLAEITDRLQEARRRQPDAAVILGAGWMFSAIPEGSPTAEMLDEVVPDIPVVLDSNDVHSSWVNTAALEAMGITASTPNPPGGEIVRDGDGRATGFLLENAAVEHAWTYLDEIATDDDRDRFLDNAFQVYLQNGVTAASDMALNEVDLATFRRRIDRDGRLPFPVSAYWLLRPTGDAEEDLQNVQRAVEVRDQVAQGPGAEWFRIAGVKFILDGVIDACTAAMRNPYANGQIPEPIWSLESASPVAVKADADGLQLALHAIGDHASEIALDLVEQCNRVNGPKIRTPRIEHLESVTDDTITRAAALGVVASMQPVHCDPAIMDNWVEMLGDERAESGFPWHKFREAGVTIALGTDAPTAPHQTSHNLFIALTTRSALEPGTQTYHEERAFAPASALTALTQHAAEAGGFVDGIGRILPGGRANLVVLDTDPFTADSDELLNSTVLRTLVDGELAWSK
ncbi:MULTISPECIES: amidohydrolase [Brevibacterium]|uniref:Amidohydrolase 3 domain-containing protein n=2 Tax=Brevibacterium TaxID=1696 RepID=A0A1H1S7B4_BRESA|nr:amidohydrolase [Brevibacterium sandarakinum]SDS43793.1 hypothetical protein SAMN04489751_2014 [Brevibacterium sandarakinum]